MNTYDYSSKNEVKTGTELHHARRYGRRSVLVLIKSAFAPAVLTLGLCASSALAMEKNLHIDQGSKTDCPTEYVANPATATDQDDAARSQFHKSRNVLDGVDGNLRGFDSNAVMLAAND